jgi:hypothetical protein
MLSAGPKRTVSLVSFDIYTEVYISENSPRAKGTAPAGKFFFFRGGV